MELRLHGAYARSWGVDLDQGLAVHPATAAYTDFLMDVADDPEVWRRRMRVLMCCFLAASYLCGCFSRKPSSVLQEKNLTAPLSTRLHSNIETQTHKHTQTHTQTQHTQTGVAEVLAAMAPCSRLYGFLGCALAAAHPRAARRGNPYRDWIDVYSGFDYLVRLGGWVWLVCCCKCLVRLC
jgi:thiaminase